MPLYTTGVCAENALGASPDCSEGCGLDVVENGVLIGESYECECEVWSVKSGWDVWVGRRLAGCTQEDNRRSFGFTALGMRTRMRRV